jgi:hypothetical protein
MRAPRRHRMPPRWLALAVLAVLLACTRTRTSSRSTTKGRGLDTPARCVVGPDKGGPLPEPALSGMPNDELKRPVPVFQGTLLTPPSQPGQLRSEVSGCLALTSPTEESAARYPALAPAEGGEGARVRINSLSKGLVVQHELSHACCLTATVEAWVEGTRVEVTEKLTGTPCGCTCSSSIRTAVGLGPGGYDLVLRVDTGEGPREVDQRRFIIAGP